MRPKIYAASLAASMKALPKRKGNIRTSRRTRLIRPGLNESPSEKEGKSEGIAIAKAKGKPQ